MSDFHGMRVYPRVGGGNQIRNFRVRMPVGLSPRGRGKLIATARALGVAGSIPAWAGETAARVRCGYGGAVYPRVGGGNWDGAGIGGARDGLSPRGRGKPSAPPSILGR